MAHNHMADDGDSKGAPDPLTTFDEYRSLLFSIAYRMLGTVADAEDMLQDAFIRWQHAPRDEIRSPKAFLVTIAPDVGGGGPHVIRESSCVASGHLL